SDRSSQARQQASRDLRWAGHAVAVRLTGANRHDSKEALPLVDAIPPLQGERGRPRCRPDCVLGDRAYDAEVIRLGLRARHILPLLAVRGTKHGSGLERWRWVVERTFAWLNQFRRLRVRYDRRADIHEAFLSLGCGLICWQSLRKSWAIGLAARSPSRFPVTVTSHPTTMSATSSSGPPMALAAGARFGPYEIVALIGAGGMGEVYKARDTRLDRSVAIKVLSTNIASNPDLRQRFEREARAIAT